MYKNPRSNSATFWRVIFTYIIAVHHYCTIYRDSIIYYKYGWWIGVEFFFILSGYLLAVEFEEKGRYKSSMGYTVYKIKKFLPHMIFSYTIMLILQAYLGEWNLKITIKNFIRYLNEVSFLKAVTYYTASGINGQTWYLSSLLLCSIVFSYLFLYHKELLKNIIVPLAPVFIYAFFLIENGTVQSTNYKGVFIHELVLRGFAAMSIGVGIYYLVKHFRLKYNSMNLISVTVVEIMLYTGAIAIMFFFNYAYQDFYCVILIAGGVFCSFVKGDCVTLIGKSKCIILLHKISYPIYLNHLIVRVFLFSLVGMQHSLLCVAIYLIIITVFSFASNKVVTWCTQWINNIFNKIFVQVG